MRKQLKQEIITERFDVAQEMQQQILILEERDKKKAHTSMQHDFEKETTARYYVPKRVFKTIRFFYV